MTFFQKLRGLWWVIQGLCIDCGEEALPNVRLHTMGLPVQDLWCRSHHPRWNGSA